MFPKHFPAVMAVVCLVGVLGAALSGNSTYALLCIGYAIVFLAATMCVAVIEDAKTECLDAVEAAKKKILAAIDDRDE